LLTHSRYFRLCREHHDAMGESVRLSGEERLGGSADARSVRAFDDGFFVLRHGFADAGRSCRG
jgi:hypothetical protein